MEVAFSLMHSYYNHYRLRFCELFFKSLECIDKVPTCESLSSTHVRRKVENVGSKEVGVSKIIKNLWGEIIIHTTLT